MTFTVDQAYVDVFSANVHHLAEQETSYVRDAVRVEEVKGKKKWFDRLKGTEARKRTGQYEKKELTQPDHSRRLLTTNTWDVNHIVSKEDIMQVLIDPKSEYAMEAAQSLNRVIDDTFIAEFAANVTVGQEGGSTVSFANDGGKTIAAGGTGLTKAKIDRVVRNWLENDVTAKDQRYLMMSPGALETLMQEEEFINNDYIMAGLDEARTGGMGMLRAPYNIALIVSNRLNVASDVVDCLAFTKSSMVLGYLFDISISVNQRFDLEGNPYGIDAELAVGGLRMEGERTQIVKCKQAA